MRPVILPQDCTIHGHRSEWWWFAGVLDTAGGSRRFWYSESLMRLGSWMVGFLSWDEVGGGGAARRLVKGMGPAAWVYSEARFDTDFQVSLAWVTGESLHTRGSMATYELRTQDALISLQRGMERPVLVGEGGVFRYGPDQQMAFYSWMRVATAGRLQVDGAWLEVRGTSWVDHQWGDLDTRRMVWRYLALQLDGGVEVMAFTAHHRDTPHHRTSHAIIRRDGVPEVVVPRLEPLPVGGRDVGTLVDLGTRGALTVTPNPPAQTLDLGLPLVPVFYEGYSQVSGTLDGGPVVGWGITELQPWEP